MRNIIYIIPFFILSCSVDTTNKIENPKETIIPKADIKADTEIKIEISGMTCEMGCVTTIRNRVNRMKGVTSFEMDFDAERTTDYAKIQLDSRLLSGEDVKNEIESIAQGIYTVVDLKSFDI